MKPRARPNRSLLVGRPPTTKRCASLFAAVIAVATTWSCGWALGDSVKRRVGGQEVAGRYVHYQAYGHYARGALQEASGDLAGAAASYGLALDYDDESPELWTKLGELYCRLDRAGYAEAFENAASINPNYAPLWRARSVCAALNNNPTVALATARRALALDPLNLRASLMLAERLEAAGNIEAAARQLDAALVLHEHSLQATQALFEFARRQHDPLRKRMASQQLASLWPLDSEQRRVLGDSNQVAAGPPRALMRAAQRQELSEKLLCGKLSEARRLGIAIGWNSSEVALHAISVGALRLALEQAQWILQSDPDNPSAWIAAVVAADLLGDTTTFKKLVARPPQNELPIDERAKSHFKSLLKRHVGSDAVRAWDSASE